MEIIGTRDKASTLNLKLKVPKNLIPRTIYKHNYPGNFVRKKRKFFDDVLRLAVVRMMLDGISEKPELEEGKTAVFILVTKVQNWLKPYNTV